MPNAPDSASTPPAPDAEAAAPSPAPGEAETADDASTPRYNANIRLIRARLADEKKMSRVRRWWQSKS